MRVSVGCSNRKYTPSSAPRLFLTEKQRRRLTMAYARESVELRVGLWAGTLALALLTSTGWAQVTASITGTVRDASGAVMAGAIVTVAHTESGLVRTAETDSSGYYAVPSLPVGQYEVSTEKIGLPCICLRWSRR